MIALHARLGIALVVVLGFATVWAIATTRRPHQLPALRAYMRLAAIALGAQALIGIVLVLMGNHPQTALHWFYGAVTVGALPVGDWASRRRTGDERLWLVGAGVVGILFGIRSIMTG